MFDFLALSQTWPLALAYLGVFGIAVAVAVIARRRIHR